jgi:hypothetical protein
MADQENGHSQLHGHHGTEENYLEGAPHKPSPKGCVALAAPPGAFRCRAPSLPIERTTGDAGLKAGRAEERGFLRQIAWRADCLLNAGG